MRGIEEPNPSVTHYSTRVLSSDRFGNFVKYFEILIRCFFMVLASLMLPTVDVLKIEWIWFLQESWPCQNQYIWQVGINLHLKSNVSWLPAPCFNLQINWMWTFTGSIIDVKFKVPSMPPSSLKDSNALFCVSFIHSSLSQDVSI